MERTKLKEGSPAVEADMSVRPRYTIVIPTYNRDDMLEQCLAHISELDYSKESLEILVVDNGGSEANSSVVNKFSSELNVIHIVNEINRGLGFSMNRGFRKSTGDYIVLLNDDAMIPQSFLRDCDAAFSTDTKVGCLGCRALEEGYFEAGDGIGTIDDSGKVVGNFTRDCGEPIEVDHVYGFCYVVSREALRIAGAYDEVLLAKPYSSANRTETDQCLLIKAAGFKVVYDPRIAVRHLAKPRPDYSELSLIWKLNHIRNTLYLFLKHYGLFGRRALALRWAFLHDVGIISMLKRPNGTNIAYFLMGLRARFSAFGHYLIYALRRRPGEVSEAQS